jgi:hypothetical protein
MMSDFAWLAILLSIIVICAFGFLSLMAWIDSWIDYKESKEQDDGCAYCKGKGEIEIDNNGPIVTCPVCNGAGL